MLLLTARATGGGEEFSSECGYSQLFLKRDDLSRAELELGSMAGLREGVAGPAALFSHDAGGGEQVVGRVFRQESFW